MKREELRRLAGGGESESLEFKSSFDREALETAGAFANAKGGTIMTIEELHDPNHNSKPRNKLIAQIFYETAIIERYGSGIQRIIAACKGAGLPKPVFEEKFGGFLVVFNKDIYTEEYMRGLGLNGRQVKAVIYVKEKGRITNKEYREIVKVSKPTASRELAMLVDLKILAQKGTTGKGTAYTLKGLTKGSNGS